MEKIKVRIKKASDKNYWYNDWIGKEFFVINHSETDYAWFDNNRNLINKSDCEIIPTRIEKPSLEFLLSLKHGQRVNLNRSGVVFEAIINKTPQFGYDLFLCQNFHNGISCSNKMGKKYSWGVYEKNFYIINWIELINEPESVKPIQEVWYEFEWSSPIDISSVTMLFEETITFTEDEQFDIQLLDEMLEHLMK